nr:hypothetical protein [Nonomuraea cypriaca]
MASAASGPQMRGGTSSSGKSEKYGSGAWYGLCGSGSETQQKNGRSRSLASRAAIASDTIRYAYWRSSGNGVASVVGPWSMSRSHAENSRCDCVTSTAPSCQYGPANESKLSGPRYMCVLPAKCIE